MPPGKLGSGAPVGRGPPATQCQLSYHLMSWVEDVRKPGSEGRVGGVGKGGRGGSPGSDGKAGGAGAEGAAEGS